MTDYFANYGNNEAKAKSLYRKLAMKLHPDKNNGDESAFKELSRQYIAFKTNKFNQNFYSGSGEQAKKAQSRDYRTEFVIFSEDLKKNVCATLKISEEQYNDMTTELGRSVVGFIGKKTGVNLGEIISQFIKSINQ